MLAPDFSRVEKEQAPPILNGFNRFPSVAANIPPVSPFAPREKKSMFFGVFSKF
jgi:hypothetical protein